MFWLTFWNIWAGFAHLEYFSHLFSSYLLFCLLHLLLFFPPSIFLPPFYSCILLCPLTFVFEMFLFMKWCKYSYDYIFRWVKYQQGWPMLSLYMAPPPPPHLTLDNFNLDSEVPENCPFVLTSPRSLEACRRADIQVVWYTGKQIVKWDKLISCRWLVGCWTSEWIKQFHRY